MSEWQPIETFPGDHPFWTSEHDEKPPAERTRYYEDALVYGPTWCPSSAWDDYPKDGKGAWTGEAEIAIASTYSGEGFWTISSRGPSDYDDYIKPTHWMPLPAPPEPSK